MKKKNIYLLAGIAVIAVAAVLAAGLTVNRNRNAEQEEHAILAMYVPYGDGHYFFIGQKDDGAFDARIPEELYDIDGKKITRSELVAGNILKIYGDGIMATSDPGQYPGVTRMEIVQEGTPSDADKYEKLVKRYYREPDPSERPTLGIEYTTDMAVVHVMATEGGYEWSYEDKNGQSQSVVADSQHMLLWKDISDLNIDGPTDLILDFSEEPDGIEAERWESSLRSDTEDQQELSQGETIEIAVKDGKAAIEKAEPGYVYRVTGIWENGRCEFGFLTN